MTATVLIIRAHKRFGVCRKAHIERENGDMIEALLIELSLEGCRVGNLAGAEFADGERLTITVPGAEAFAGQVRWQGRGAVGLRLETAFHIAELDHLIRYCRGEFDADGDARDAYGT